MDRKLSRFLTAAMRVYRVPEDELEQTVRFVERLDIRSIAERVMHTLFQTLAMHYDFSLPEMEAPLISETEETT